MKRENLNQYNKYSFVVSKDCNSYEIKKAIETTFKVKVEKVNTLVVRGKIKSFNGMSWDGFSSLEQILNFSSYNEGAVQDNKYYNAFLEEIKDEDITDFASAKQSGIYELIDSSFN